MDPTAKAAAYSPARSDPGQDAFMPTVGLCNLWLGHSSGRPLNILSKTLHAYEL